ncbi:MAG: lysophospholipid acyltransferase family protein [Planctomycetota bacterium]
MIRDGLAMTLKVMCGCHARGLEHIIGDAPRLYFANHTSNLDAVVVWSSLPRGCRRRCRVLAAGDYWQRGPVRRLLAERAFRAILFDREHVTKQKNPVRAICACLGAGESVIMFPEGTRGEGAELGPLRPGLWHIARRLTDVDLVPVWIENLSRVLPKGEVLPVPMVVATTFGPPIRLFSDEGKAVFLDRATTALRELRSVGP